METKLRCLIVDDEPIALALLENYVSKTPLLELSGKCGSAVEALSLISQVPIDLIFLDIQMPDLNGLEFSKLISKDIRIVFTTAYDQYALDGFKVEALDYLLKPFSYQEFLSSAMKANEWFSLKRNSVQHPATEKELDFIFVKSEYKQVKIDLNMVYYFEGMKDYVKIWLKNEPKPVMTLMSLKSLEEMLPTSRFMRIHRSFIVSLKEIVSVERGNIQINHQFIPVADQYKQAFQAFLDNNSIS